jgi:hypothetical protein
MIDFPASPTIGEQFTSGGFVWEWDGIKWTIVPGSGASGAFVTISDTPPASPAVGDLWWDSVGGQTYLWMTDANSSQWVPASNSASLPPPASTTVLGGVKVDGTSIKAAADGTISTVLIPMNDNRLINGDMRIDQRGVASGGGTANGYTVDRWQFQASLVGNGFWQRVASAAPGFPYYLNFTSSSAYASLAADFFFFQQPIEADAISDFAWGTANAQPVTLSFWAFSSLTGTFSGCVKNYAATRSYPFTFSIPVVNTWTKIAVTIPGDTAGTWVLSGSNGALYVVFDLGSGSTYRGPAGAWASANYQGATGAVSVVGTNGAAWGVTGVKLEIGSVATPYNRQSLAKSLADCQRYYQSLGTMNPNSYQVGGGVYNNVYTFPVTMRAVPTMGLSSVSYGNASGGQVIAPTTSSFGLGFTNTATALGYMYCNVTASAEL